MRAANCSNFLTIPQDPIYTANTPNRDWVVALRGSEREQATADLRHLLITGLCAGLGGRYGDALDTNLDRILSDALVEIDRSLEKIPGDRRFTSWALKTAVHLGIGILRQR